VADTIEAFVKRLRQDGVDAGRSEAETLIAAAKAEAARIVAAAERDAATRRQQAEAEAARLLAKGRADLSLAVRDTVARLRMSLGVILTDLLARRAGRSLRDPDLVAEAIVALVRAHTAAGRAVPDVRVEPGLRDRVVASALAALAEEVAAGKVGEAMIVAGCEQPGFTYVVEGATVSVDVQSVVEHLGEMVNPALREAIVAALAPGAA
jgi:V/A-type H+-transporting ATPase subunit E